MNEAVIQPYIDAVLFVHHHRDQTNKGREMEKGTELPEQVWICIEAQQRCMPTAEESCATRSSPVVVVVHQQCMQRPAGCCDLGLAWNVRGRCPGLP